MVNERRHRRLDQVDEVRVRRLEDGHDGPQATPLVGGKPDARRSTRDRATGAVVGPMKPCSGLRWRLRLGEEDQHGLHPLADVVGAAEPELQKDRVEVLLNGPLRQEELLRYH